MIPTEEILREVPTTILHQVKAHLACLQAFNADITRWRTMEQRLGTPGRYEYEYRLQREPEVQQSSAWLDRFAARAQENGVDPEAVFGALGGRQALESWSPAAQAWQREEPHEEEHTDA